MGDLDGRSAQLDYENVLPRGLGTARLSSASAHYDRFASKSFYHVSAREDQHVICYPRSMHEQRNPFDRRRTTQEDPVFTSQRIVKATASANKRPTPAELSAEIVLLVMPANFTQSAYFFISRFRSIVGHLLGDQRATYNKGLLYAFVLVPYFRVFIVIGGICQRNTFEIPEGTADMMLIEFRG